MREILFRGKRIDNGEWIYGQLWVNRTATRETAYIVLDDGDMEEVEPSTIGQYIGLKDKNGVKIFEGDSVMCCGGEFYHGIYEFDENVEAKFETYALSCLHGSDSLEVIDNIHDNSEVGIDLGD